MEVKVLDEIKNKRGEIKEKIVRIKNKDNRKGLGINTINKIYKDLINIKKLKPEQIQIVGKFLHGNINTVKERENWITLKNFKNTDKTLNFDDENYLNNQPLDIKNKLARYYSIDIYIKL